MELLYLLLKGHFTQKSADIVSLFLLADLIDAADHKKDFAILRTDRTPLTVDPDRFLIDTHPAITQIVPGLTPTAHLAHICK